MSRQREKLKELVIAFCNKKGSRTFSLQELHNEYGDYSQIQIGGQTPTATVRRLLQDLRDDGGFISFLEKSGHYTLRGIELLDSEKDDLQQIDISKETPDKKEYLTEVYVRSTKWAIQAKEALGNYCLMHGCENTFIKPDNNPYIEVHHIIPLHEGGEDGLWNLSVLCAHHHRMAHFAREKEKIYIRDFLSDKVGGMLP